MKTSTYCPKLPGQQVSSPHARGWSPIEEDDVDANTYQFRYQNGDAEPEATIDADGVASITWTPTQSTGYILVVRSRTATGTVSADLWYWFSVGWSG